MPHHSRPPVSSHGVYAGQGLGKPPGECTFTDDAGVTWNVADWFAEKENVRQLKHPELPCVLFGKDGKNAVPMELCMLVEQDFKNLSSEERSEVVKKTSDAPAKRKQTCDELLSQVRSEMRSKGATAAAFGIEIDDAPMSIIGRQLERMPLLFAGNRKQVPNEKGSWNLWDGRGELQLHFPATIRRAVAIDFCPRPVDKRNVAKVFDRICDVSDMRGMQIGRFDHRGNRDGPVIDRMHDYDGRGVDAFLSEKLQGLGPRDLVFAILPDKPQRDDRTVPRDVYQHFKGWCASHGLASQCLLKTTVRFLSHSLPSPSSHTMVCPSRQIDSESADRKLQHYVNNVLLKVNIKMGGVNWVAGAATLLDATPTLLVGLDVQ